MKRMLSVILAFFLLTSVVVSEEPLYASAEGETVDYGYEIIPDELLVTVVPGATTSQELGTLETLTASSGGTVELMGCDVSDINQMHTINGNDTVESIQSYFIKTSSANEAVSLISQLKQQQDVLYVEYNGYLETCYSYDPDYAQQWALEKIGVGTSWDMGFTGSANIKIAIIDTGVNAHPELTTNVDFSQGRNFVDNTSNVADGFGHGTFVAGLIGAAINGSGMSGACKNITIIPYKVSSGANAGLEVYAVKEAINYAINNDIDIINYSAAMPEELQSILHYISLYSGIFVTAAGNAGTDMSNDSVNSGKINYLSNMVVVGSSNSNDGIAEHSNYSNTFVDVFAPGDNIYSTNNTNGLSIDSGTSFATPYFAAAAALIWSNATHYDNEDVIDLLLDNVTPIVSMIDKCSSGGRLHIPTAITALYNEMRPAYSKGDLNGDGYVNSTDKTICRNIVSGTTPTTQQFYAGDIDGDGFITTVDYMRIGSYLSKTSYFAP